MGPEVKLARRAVLESLDDVELVVVVLDVRLRSGTRERKNETEEGRVDGASRRNVSFLNPKTTVTQTNNINTDVPG